MLAQLSAELAERYEQVDAGSGRFLPEDALQPGGLFLVGKVASQVIACGALRPLQPGVVEIKRMFVTPAFRGRGIGKQLLEELERHARQMGYRLVRLEAGLKLTEAMRMYEAAGYRTIPLYAAHCGHVPSVGYEKQLCS